MGWFSSVVNVVRGVVRGVVNIIEEVVGFVIGGLSSLFLFWVRKKIRIRVCVLHKKGSKPTVSVPDVDASMDRMNALLKRKFNVKIITYGAPHIYFVPQDAPDSALTIECAFSGYLKEFGEAGAFFSDFADNIPLVCPVTVFVIDSVTNNGNQWRGCSSGLMTNFVVITPDGLNDDTTLMHEVGHACLLFHRKKKKNLMYHGASRGTSITGWQKWWFRASRRVNYW